ncbi:hypothetical protein [Canibacter zhoujuaniae]|uniref:hypothetical protein n=1 Tax=Canibacter zhoujuaniae TaxID=2708343 RepID=UPI00141F1886|nr:hypothetical protein [Canibacter zhoujuaniae]
MNTTPRGLNRIALLLFGLILLVTGAALLAFQFVPQVQDTWHDVAAGVADVTRTESVAGVQLPAAWPAIAVIVICALLALFALLHIFAQSSGRVGHFYKRSANNDSTTAGAVMLQGSFAEDLLKPRLEGHKAIAAAHVTARNTGKQRALKVRVDTRRGAHLSEVTRACQQAADEFVQLLGYEPVIVFEIKNGVRSALLGEQRVL